MKMTMTQKILAEKAGLPYVEPDQLIMASIDLCLANDITGPVAVKEFEKAGFTKVFDNTKVAFVLDHFTPNKDIKSAEHCKLLREFAKKYEIVNYFEGGRCGVEHAIIPEHGLAVAGDLIIGADSHTCTYGALNAFSTGVGSTDMAAGMASGKVWLKVPRAICFKLSGKFRKNVSGKDLILYIIGKIGVDGALYKSMEFVGEGVSNLSMDDRFTIANMAIEAGAKNGIFIADDLTAEYIKKHSNRQYKTYAPDEDAPYDEVYEIDLSQIEPMVAFPHLPSNTKTAKEAESLKIKIDQVVIGSCTNGRLSDLKAAAEILKGKKCAEDVRVIIMPATPKIYKEALDLGYLSIFMDAGCIISPPTCGPCLGGHMGILAKGERALSTTNRNFVGRMGHPESEVYLCSPQVAAYSAITGYISCPEF